MISRLREKIEFEIHAYAMSMTRLEGDDDSDTIMQDYCSLGYRHAYMTYRRYRAPLIVITLQSTSR